LIDVGGGTHCVSCFGSQPHRTDDDDDDDGCIVLSMLVWI
jgi:hypothetical protein